MVRILRVSLLFSALAGCYFTFAQEDYEDFFTDRSLRFEFMLAGDHSSATVFPLGSREEPFWAGSKVNRLDTLGYGSYRYRVIDDSTGEPLFSRGFCTLFQEWQTTPAARVSTGAFYQSLFFPFPKRKVRLILEQRNRSGLYEFLYSAVVDPADYFIGREQPQANDTVRLLFNGDPATHVDLVFLAEGYSEGEKGKFTGDVERMCDALFSVSPFDSMRSSFNVTAVWTPSAESGTDLPGEHLYRNTRFSSTFYTFGSDRYLTTSDMRPVYDAAACTPWDQLIVLVNSERYGGGGIYNLVSVCTTGHPQSGRVLVHEFGHAFAGLGDEYYNSSVAYEDYYNLAIEPWEPNLTTLKDFGSKWKDMVPGGVPVPTPRIPSWYGVTGVFEGGGYVEKGIYSPAMDCRMKSNQAKHFCPVCERAIRRAVRWVAGG